MRLLRFYRSPLYRATSSPVIRLVPGLDDMTLGIFTSMVTNKSLEKAPKPPTQKTVLLSTPTPDNRKYKPSCERVRVC